MKNLQSKLLVLVAFFTFGLIISSCAPDLKKEFNDANMELDLLKQSDAPAEDIAEVEALIAEAQALMDAGDHLGARKKLEEARFRAIEAKGRAELAALDEDRELRFGEILDIGLMDILFDYDQSRVRADAAPALTENARIIKNHADQIKVVIIEGYCDTRGTDEYNLALGDKRAKSVAAYLAGIGVDVNIIESVGKGETDEWGSDASEFAYSKNRRAHFKVLASSSILNGLVTAPLKPYFKKSDIMGAFEYPLETIAFISGSISISFFIASSAPIPPGIVKSIITTSYFSPCSLALIYRSIASLPSEAKATSYPI